MKQSNLKMILPKPLAYCHLFLSQKHRRENQLDQPLRASVFISHQTGCCQIWHSHYLVRQSQAYNNQRTQHSHTEATCVDLWSTLGVKVSLYVIPFNLMIKESLLKCFNCFILAPMKKKKNYIISWEFANARCPNSAFSWVSDGVK